MAKIVVNVDTETKNLEVLVDGQPLSDISDVHFCSYPSYEDKGEKELHISIMMSNKDEESGLTTTKHIMAKHNKLPEAVPSKSFAGLYELKTVDKAFNDIQKYFKRFGV